MKSLEQIITDSWLSAGVVVVFSFLIWGLAQAGALNSVATPVASTQDTNKPSIVLILTDDQRWDTLWAMPTVQDELVKPGINFSNGFVVNSLCCPSRASILTGQYSHSTDVYRNEFPHGAFQAFNDKSTVATWLQEVGYKTSFIGKYLNHYEGPYVPPGWNQWVAFNGLPAYYGYGLTVNGEIRSFGREESDYSTDVLGNEAVSFIRQNQGPIFLVYAPFAPHIPWMPPLRHKDAFADLPRYEPPSFNEEDVSDKPDWVRHLQPLSENYQNGLLEFRRNQYRTLLSVDEVVGQIIQSLKDTGRLNNTMIVFMSDNGYSWGEHRWSSAKETAYEENIRVPFVVRYDALVKNPGTESKQLVLNIDLAPTFAELAKTDAPGAEGASFLSLLAGPDINWRTDFLIEHLKAGNAGNSRKIPTYCAIRNQDFSYVDYKTGEKELYDIVNDPYQLDNLASDPDYQSILEQMRIRTMELCNPLPPGFSQ